MKLVPLLLVITLVACGRRDEHSMTPLMRAARNGDTLVLKRELRFGSVDARVKPHPAWKVLLAFVSWMQALPERNPGWTALMFAVDSSRYDAARILLDHHADPSVAAGSVTPLDIAAVRRDARMLRLLLERGANAGGAARHGVLPLQYALQAGDSLLVRLLISRGADINSAELRPFTFRQKLEDQQLFDAVKAGDIAAMRTALKKGADPNAVDVRGRSVLMEAVSELSQQGLDELMAAGARINAHEARPLMFVAVVRGRMRLFEQLLDMGIKPHDSYIADAVRAGQVAMVKRLLELGLDPGAKDATGRSAIELAALLKNPEIIALLPDSLNSTP